MFGLKSLAVGSVAAVLFAVTAPAATAAATVDYAANSAGSSSNTASSTDWSGWDVTGGTYTSVSAAWTIPDVACATGETSYSANWVGLDGDGSNSVEQTGTPSDCTAGIPAYSAWYEFYPSVAVTVPDTVKAGDRITASVVSVKGTDQFTLVLTDLTRGWTKTETDDSPEGTGASAEIIAEAPSGSGRTDSMLPLADFKTVTFSNVLVSGATSAAAGGASKIATVDDYENPMATDSDLAGSGAIAVIWVSSGVSAGMEQSSSTQGCTSRTGGHGWPGSISGGYGAGAGGRGYSGGSASPDTWTDTVGEGAGYGTTLSTG